MPDVASVPVHASLKEFVVATSLQQAVGLVNFTPVGAVVSRKIESLASETNPTLFLNSASTVFTPSPAGSVMDMFGVYGWKVSLSSAPSVLTRTCEMPVPEIASEADVEAVATAPLSMTIFPVAGAGGT